MNRDNPTRRRVSPSIRAMIIGATLSAGLAASGAANAALVANATSADGGFSYIGLGESSPGSNLGTGNVQFGNCAFDGTNTVCKLNGAYQEAGSSTNDPGGTGTYQVIHTYAGNGPSTAIGQSIDPAGDIFSFSSLGDSVFELFVTTSAGKMFNALFPDTPFDNSFGFGGLADPAQTVCTGLSAAVACSVGQVGLVAGATLNGPLQSFGFTIPDSILNAGSGGSGNPPDMSEIPVPGAAILFLSGLAGFGVFRKRAKA